MKLKVLAIAALAAFSAFAQDGSAKNPFRHKVALIAGFGEGSDKATTVKKFAAAFSDSHASTFVFASKVRPGADRFRVLDASGTVVYEGEDDREAEAAVVNALTEMPVPGQLINGVVLKKFKKYEKNFVMGKKNLETWIAEDLEAGDKGAALRDINWFVKTWPSEKGKYDADYKKLMADPEAVKAAKALMAPPKRRR